MSKGASTSAYMDGPKWNPFAGPPEPSTSTSRIHPYLNVSSNPFDEEGHVYQCGTEAIKDYSEQFLWLEIRHTTSKCMDLDFPLKSSQVSIGLLFLKQEKSVSERAQTFDFSLLKQFQGTP